MVLLMTENDREFYNNMKLVPQVGYCSRVDTRWIKTEQRKRERSEKAEKKKELQGAVACATGDSSDEESEQLIGKEADYELSPVKKKKYEFRDVEKTQDHDEIPPSLRNLRSSLRTVRPEVYEAISNLKSRYHMSQYQAEGAVIEVGNKLFQRSWKMYDPNAPSDPNTLPAGSNMRRIEPYMEAMALASITEEVMGGGV